MKKKFKSLSADLQKFIVPESAAASTLPLSEAAKSSQPVSRYAELTLKHCNGGAHQMQRMRYREAFFWRRFSCATQAASRRRLALMDGASPQSLRGPLGECGLPLCGLKPRLPQCAAAPGSTYSCRACTVWRVYACDSERVATRDSGRGPG